MAFAMLIVSFVENMALFIVIYSVLIGISTGLMYMLPIVCGWKYFPNNKGMVSGIIIAGYGFGSFFFTLICNAIVNPDNSKPSVKKIETDGSTQLYFDSNVYDKVPTMFRVLFGVFIGLGTIGGLLIKYPKDLHLEL
jgi:OFA family oxalate/formate antiporter-like MFS transporter